VRRRRLGALLRPGSLDTRRAELRSLFRRSGEVVLLAAITGAITGVFVRVFEYVVIEVMFEYVIEAELWVVAIAPIGGLVISAVLLRTLGGGTSNATSDEYLRAFHDPSYPLRLRPFVARTMAAVATLGSGGSLGLEGPSLYGGATLGDNIQRRLPRPFRGTDQRTLLVAGAAAGVAAIFKAPATGAIFALEVPFRDELARRMLLPALVSSASGYLVFVTLTDTSAIFRIVEVPLFSLRDLFGAVLLGATCAVGARGFAKAMRIAKGFSLRPMGIRLVVASLGLLGLFVLTRALTGENLSVGTGYEVITQWLADPELSVWLIFAVFLIRCLASAFTMAGGGVGGVFVPLVVGGALVGRGVGEIVNPDRSTLYVLLGVAAFLGAGYRVPIAAIMFVAETTGRPTFIVPALFAAVAAELVMGEQSITQFQRGPNDER
jgi:CIC family chloride channel protein